MSAYITHTNLAVRKIMEAMRTGYVRKKRYSVSTRLKLHMRQMITEGTRVLWKESAHRLRATFQYFAESFGGKCALEMRHPFLYFVRLVPISEFLYANFSFTCVRCTYLLKSWCDRWTYASRSMRTPRFNPSNDVRLWPAEVTSSRVVVV